MFSFLANRKSLRPWLLYAVFANELAISGAINCEDSICMHRGASLVQNRLLGASIKNVNLIKASGTAETPTIIEGSSITIVGTSKASSKVSDPMSITLPSSVAPGDVVILFLGQSDASDLSAPSDWKSILAKGPDDVNQEVLYKVYQSRGAKTFTFSGKRNNFVCAVTLRGVNVDNPIRASWSGKDTSRGGESGCSRGHRGRAKATTPIATEPNGVRLLSCMFDDPFVGEVFTSSSHTTKAMKTLEAWKNGDDGLMVAIEGTDGSETSDRYIQGSDCETGGGNDIVFSFSLNPSSRSPPSPPSPPTHDGIGPTDSSMRIKNIFDDSFSSPSSTPTSTPTPAPRNFATPKPPLESVSNPLRAGNRLHSGQYISSRNGQARLELDNGNLVLRSQGRVLWSSGTSTADRLSLQSDGNLVLRDAGGSALWSSSTHDEGAERLEVQDDCNLVLYRSSSSDSSISVWATGTKCA